jgi:hypothetical protein
LRRDCLIKHIIEGKIEEWLEMTGRQGSRRKQLPNDHDGRRGYCKSKEDELDLFYEMNE